MEGEEQESGALGERGAGSLGATDFGGTGQEDEQVTARFLGERAFDGGGYLLFEWGGGVRGVLDLQGILAAFGAQNGGAAEIAGDGGGIEGGRHDDEAKVGAVGALEAAEKSEGEIAFEVALVEFVEYDATDLVQARVAEEAAREDAFGEEAQAGLRAGHIFEADLIADGGADGLVALGGDEAGGEAGGEAARLEDEDLTRIEGEEGGRDSRGLAGSGRGLEDDAGVVAKVRQEVGQEGIDGQAHVFPW